MKQSKKHPSPLHLTLRADFHLSRCDKRTQDGTSKYSKENPSDPSSLNLSLRCSVLRHCSWKLSCLLKCTRFHRTPREKNVTHTPTLLRIAKANGNDKHSQTKFCMRNIIEKEKSSQIMAGGRRPPHCWQFHALGSIQSEQSAQDLTRPGPELIAPNAENLSEGKTECAAAVLRVQPPKCSSYEAPRSVAGRKAQEWRGKCPKTHPLTTDRT